MNNHNQNNQQRTPGGPGGRRDNRRGFQRPAKEKSEFDSKLLDLARVARVTKGGKRFSFRATMVVGDSKGRVGVGVAQGHDVQQAMEKSTQNAKKHLVRVSITNGTIAHEVLHKYHSAIIVIKPAPTGSGVKAGGAVRVIAKLAGIHNITAKLIGRTGNKINIARATIQALSKLKVKEHATPTNPS